MRAHTREIGFAHVDLRGSVVLGWESSADGLLVRLEVSLLPSHPEYEAPRPDERSCFRHGLLTFGNPSSMTGLLAQESVRPSTDPDGSGDYDTLHGLWSDEPGSYLLEGELGEVRLISEPPTIRLSESGWTATGA